MNFVVLAFSGIAIDAAGNPDFANARDDIAPDAGRGTYAYQVLTTFSLRVVGFTTGPKPAKAGTTFSAGLAATQSDTAGLVAQGNGDVQRQDRRPARAREDESRPQRSGGLRLVDPRDRKRQDDPGHDHAHRPGDAGQAQLLAADLPLAARCETHGPATAKRAPSG